MSSSLGPLLFQISRRARATSNLYRRFSYGSPGRTRTRIACLPFKVMTFGGSTGRCFSCCPALYKDDPPDAMHESMRDLWDDSNEPVESSSELFTSSSSRDFWEADAASSEEGIATVVQECADQAFSFSSLLPPTLIQNMLEYIHATTGMPWWVTIAACTLCIRISMLPIMLYVRSNSKKMSVVQPQVAVFKERSMAYYNAGDKARFSEEHKKMKALYKQHNIKPYLTVLPIISQLIIIASFFFAIRNMTGVPLEGLATEGVLWFQDLAVPDPYYILPIVNCITVTASIAMNLTESEEFPDHMKRIKPLMLVMNVVFLYITTGFPSGLCVYLVTSSSYSLIFAVFMKLLQKMKRTTPAVKPKDIPSGDVKRIVRALGHAEPKHKHVKKGFSNHHKRRY